MINLFPFNMVLFGGEGKVKEGRTLAQRGNLRIRIQAVAAGGSRCRHVEKKSLSRHNVENLFFGGLKFVFNGTNAA